MDNIFKEQKGQVKKKNKSCNDIPDSAVVQKFIIFVPDLTDKNQDLKV